MSFEFWFMFPVSILVATVAMASGVEGATFFTPIFLLALRLPPEVAIGTGLITEVFGFSSGLFAYMRKQLIDYRLGFQLLWVTVPLALIGTWASSQIAPDMLKVILGIGLFAIAVSFLRSPSHEEVKHLDSEISAESIHQTCIQPAVGQEICYTVCNRTEGRLLSGLGALFMGLVSTGLGEMNGYFLLRRCRVPSAVAVATSVLVVTVTALTAAGGHLYQFVQEGGDTMSTVLSLVTFTVPGVLIGGQVGPWVAHRISQSMLERLMGILFIAIAVLTLWGVVR